MSDTRKAYIDRIKLQLDEFDVQMDQLEEKIRDATEEARANYRIEMAKLRLQSEQAADTFRKLRAEGASDWDKLVLEMNKVRNAFSHALKDFKAHL